MPYTSSFFNSTHPGQTSEQSLIDDLVIEQIGIYGLDVLYMPRRHLNLDKLLHESTKNAFEMALPMPMYLKSFSGYDNSMELLTKFGVRSSDEITLVMSRSQFTSYYGPYLKSYYNELNGDEPTDKLNPLDGEIATRPKEGDLIYFPFDDGIFEIKYVMFDSPFFQLGRGYVFELQCEKFEYSGETFDTGYDGIDEQQVRPDYYRLEFSIKGDGLGTFEALEEVEIYDITSEQNLANELKDPLATEERIDIVVDDIFQLYNDSGFISRFDKVTGRVLDWNKPDGKLIVNDLSNLDPDSEDENKDVTKNKFDVVLVVGLVSGAQYVTVKSDQMEAPFSDNDVIQKEFDAIKIVDIADDNPFGFV
jgi:hypothetical protein